MTPNRGTDRQLVILLITIAGGVGGGLLANWFSGLRPGVLVLVLLASTTAATVIAFALLTAKPREVRHAPAPPSGGDPGSRANSSGQQAPPPAHPRPDAPGRVVLPLQQPAESGGRQWWTEAGSNSRGKPAAQTVAAPSLASYEAHRALIAQCPRCGDFRLDVSQAGGNCAFRCRNPRCGNTWTWAPGTPWPSVVVRRNLTGGSPDRAR